MATQQVYGTTDRATGDSSHGQNTIIHYYDKAGIKAANAIAVYAQFADRRSMPLKRGTTYKVSKWLHIYDREDGVDADFATKGYLTARSIVDVSDGLSNDATLGEGAGAVNKRSIKKVTISGNFARYGEMIDYTDEIELFSEDMVQVHYREELGFLANRRAEDLIQLDMLSTTNLMVAGTATSIDTLANATDVGATDGTEDDNARISYDLIRKAVRRLVRNRAQRNTSIVTGSTKIDTRVVNRAFYAIIGPEIKYDLESAVRATGATSADSTEYVYIPAYKYASATNLAEGEVGAMNDVRFIETESGVVYRGAGSLTYSATTPGNSDYVGTLANTILTAAQASSLSAITGKTYANADRRYDVFPILFPTKGSFATIGLKGHGKIKFNSQAPSKIELGNPYGTSGFFSYNMWYASIILREERLLKVLVCASD